MLVSIQYIRALAALMVVITHTYGGFGAQGVDIFFVLSGYIMMHVMHFNHRGALEFFLARFLRVAPIYYIFTLIAIIAGHSYEPTIEHIIHSLLFLKVKWSAPVLSVGWTLEYEFVFYCLCAFSLTLPIQKYRPYLIAALLLLLSILLDAILFPEKAYGHFLEFIFGMMCFYFITQVVEKRGLKPNKILLLCIAISSLASLYLVQTNVYPDEKLPFRFIGYGLLSLVFCCAFILLEEYLPKSNLGILFGNASYSIYITHITTLFFYYKFWDVKRNDSIFSDTISVLTVLAVGILAHLLIERPIAKSLSAKVFSNKLLTIFPLTYLPKNWLQRTQ